MRSTVRTIRSRTRPRAASAAVGDAPPAAIAATAIDRGDVRAGGGREAELSLLKDDRPVFEEETEQRVHVVTPAPGRAFGLRADCTPSAEEPPSRVATAQLVTATALRCVYPADYVAAARQAPRELLVGSIARFELLRSPGAPRWCAPRGSSPGPNNSGAPQPIEERHVGRERKHRRRKPGTVCSLTSGTRSISSDVTNRSSGRIARECPPPDRPCETAPPPTRAARSRSARPSLDQPDAVIRRPELRIRRQRDRSQRDQRVDQLVDRRLAVLRRRRVRRSSRRS